MMGVGSFRRHSGRFIGDRGKVREINRVEGLMQNDVGFKISPQ